MKSHSWYPTLAIAIATFFAGMAAGHYTTTNNSQLLLFCIITLAGAFGGLLYAARENGFEFPHQQQDSEHSVELGWLADCAYGIAGGYVAFLLLPTDFGGGAQASASKILSDNQAFGVVKLIALAIVGGYGGRGLVDRALSTIAKDIKDVKREAKETKRRVTQIQEIDTKILELLNRHFDEDESAQGDQAVKDAVSQASQGARFQIFRDARMLRKSNWKKKPKFMARTISVFEALAEHPDDQSLHRCHGQLAYALKDSNDSRRDLARSYELLNNSYSNAR